MATRRLAGVWKISSHVRGEASTVLPRRIRFDGADEQGCCSIPYADHCQGTWEVRTQSSSAAAKEASEAGAHGNGGVPLFARWKLHCAAHRGMDESCHVYEGLFDGERIAGTVSNAAGEPVADFLCTRLFTFWGTPSPRASRQE
jgi:hypothetical protein